VTGFFGGTVVVRPDDSDGVGPFTPMYEATLEAEEKSISGGAR